MSVPRIGTRGSPLARWQAEQVAAAIRASGGPECAIVTIATSGDRLSRRPLSEAGGKRMFVKEIEEALLTNEIDLAVHSAKDLPAALPEGLRIDAALRREDPRDALIAPVTTQAPPSEAGPLIAAAGRLIAAAGRRARVGTGSVRRTAQLVRAFPGIELAPVRGNVGTRLRKLDEGHYDLLVLAVAGLARLQLTNRISARLATDVCVPAPGQGILAVETRTADTTTRDLIAHLGETATAVALEAERALVSALGADCQVPVGALATLEDDAVTLVGVVASPDGARLLRHRASAPARDAASLGREVAARLLADGADEVLAGLGER